MALTRGTLLKELEKSGQEHIVIHLERIGSIERERLEEQLLSFDYKLVRRLREKVLARKSGEAPTAPKIKYSPAPMIPIEGQEAESKKLRKLGEEAILSGEVAVFIAAGGQGSRLSFPGPKGCYEISPVTSKTLFQLHTEKVLAINRKHGLNIPLVLMTSESSDAEIRTFFHNNNNFGLEPDGVFFCLQRMMPAIDLDGRMLLERTDRIFVNPDGHGGAYHALAASGVLDELKRRKIKTLSYLQVDNPLVNLLDKAFIGAHKQAKSQFSSKAVLKVDPAEKLGLFVLVNKKLEVVEYSDISAELQSERVEGGRLKYCAGNIAVHIIDLAFAAKMAKSELPFHEAFKSIPHLGAGGKLVHPESPNAIKFERFIFDAIPLAKNPLVVETSREEEFAPLKNATGADSPETCRRAMSEQHRRWLQKAGVEVPPDADVEISPLAATEPDDLLSRESDEGIYIKKPSPET